MRYTILDGFRGFFLLFMAIVHINVFVDVLIGKLNHHYAGWVEDAQGFVFISGLVVGLHYGKLMLRRSYADMSTAIWHRLKTIYSHQLGLIIIFTAAAFAIAAFGVYPHVLQPYTGGEYLLFVITSALLINGSMHMGILPMYIYFMMLSPFILIAFRHGYALPIAVLSSWAWYFAQTGLVDIGESAIEGILAGAGHPITLGIFFNIFGWQIIFYFGLYLGYRFIEGNLDLSFLRRRSHFILFMIIIASLVFFAVLDRLVFWDLISPEYTRFFLSVNVRQDFGLVYIVNFAAALYAIGWIVVAGPECGLQPLEKFSRFIIWLFTRRFLVFLGQHSLHVFSFHLLTVYTLACILDGKRVSEVLGSIVLIAGTASIYLAAFGHAWLQRRSAETKTAKPRVMASRQKPVRQQGGKRTFPVGRR